MTIGFCALYRFLRNPVTTIIPRLSEPVNDSDLILPTKSQLNDLTNYYNIAV